MRRKIFSLGLGVIILGLGLLTQPVQAASIYGALFETGHLAAVNGSNKESVLAYYPEEDGFIALTSNDSGLEWWTSDGLGLNWTLSEANPLTEYGCTMAGRHTVTNYQNDVYFAASCGQDMAGKIFKITGLDTVELIHSNETGLDGGIGTSYPTATVLNDVLYMFFNSGYTACDAATCTDITDALGQTMGVPLEASSEQDGYIYLAQTSGEVHKFDGLTYETIGTGYLESLEASPDNNLPAIEVYNGYVYVGNLDFNNGASLFRYDGTAWEEIYNLDQDDTIINKMELSSDIDGQQYLVFYTSNNQTGTNIYALDEEENLVQLINSGLGGKNPTNNSEVVSLINRTVDDNGSAKEIMLFGTQNILDQTKIFALNLDPDLAIDPVKKNVISTASRMTAMAKATHPKGEVFKYQIKKALVTKGEVYSLWVGGEKVDSATATSKKAITLTYKGAKNKKVGQVFKVRIGVKHVYGQGEDQEKAHNVIKGSKIKVTVRKNSSS